MLKIHTQLPEELEEIVQKTIGCCIAVHQGLGPGLLERIYAKAIGIELENRGLTFEAERAFPIYYGGRLLCEQRVDLVVENRVLLEIKAVERLDPVHRAQILSYLRVSGMKVGLLMNFNVAVLRDGLKRFVL